MHYYGTAIPEKTTTEFLFLLEFFPVKRLYMMTQIIFWLEIRY